MAAAEKVIETDVLVIGGGIAGCFAAIKAKNRGVDVTLVDKNYIGKSGSTHFGGGYIVIFNPEWGHDFNAWMDRINKTCEYVNNREFTELVLKDSYARYEDLVSWGVEFIKENGELKKYTDLNPPLEARHIRRLTLAPTLRKQAEKVGIRIIDRVMITDLLKQDGSIVGAIGFPMENNETYIFKAKATVVSAGLTHFKSSGQHVHFLTGDSSAMAYRVGAEVTGKEYRSLAVTMADYPAWRGHANAIARYYGFVDADYKELKSSFTAWFYRDFAVHEGRGPVYWDLDAATPEDVKAIQFHQQIYSTPNEWERIGLDVSKGGKIRMVGGAGEGSSVHSGEGVWPINTQCATCVPGLYVAGEACGGRHAHAFYPHPGFASNTCAVTGTRAGEGAAEYAKKRGNLTLNKEELEKAKSILYAPTTHKGGFSPRWVTQVFHGLTIPYFILGIKHHDRLTAALTLIEFIRDHLIPKLTAADTHELRLAHETRNMVLNAEMRMRASLFRTESRGCHYREDYPRRDDPTWLAWVKLGQDEDGNMKVMKEPIPKEWWPDLSLPYEERYPARFPGE